MPLEFLRPLLESPTQFSLSTAWLFTNAIRIQHKLPEYGLELDKLGAFFRQPFWIGASGLPMVKRSILKTIRRRNGAAVRRLRCSIKHGVAGTPASPTNR